MPRATFDSGKDSAHARAQPFWPRIFGYNGHARAFRRPHGDRRCVEAVEAEDVHAIMIWCRALAVEQIDAAAPAEIMLRDTAVPFVEGQERVAREDGQRRFRHLRHHRVAFHAERAVAGGQFLDLVPHRETHTAAMAGSLMLARHIALPSTVRDRRPRAVRAGAITPFARGLSPQQMIDELPERAEAGEPHRPF